MLFGRLGCRALMSAGVAVGIAAVGAGGFGPTASDAASFSVPPIAMGDAVLRVQTSPQPAPCGTAASAPCKEPQAKPKPKREKQRKISPCGPGLAPCPNAT
jgi:hypothetical protein